MKIRLVAIVTVLLLTFQMVVFAEFQLGTSEDELTVGGIASPYESVAFVLIDADNIVPSDGEITLESALNAYKAKLASGDVLTNSDIFNFQRVEAGADGKWFYTMPMTGITTKNLVFFSSEGESDYIQYASVSFRTNMIPELKSAAATDTDTLDSKITYYIGYIADRAKQYKNLKNTKKVAEFSKDAISGIDQEDESALDSLKMVVDNSILVCGVNEGKITDFDDVISIVSYDAKEKDNISDAGKEKVVALLKDGTYTSVADYQEKAKVHFALQHFNYNINQNSDHLLEVLEENNKVLKLDLSDLYDLKTSKQSKAAEMLAGKHSETVEDAQDNLDDIISDLKEDEYKGGSGGKGNGGGSGKGSYTTINESKVHSSNASNSISNEYLQEQKYIYSDMKDAPWAADAILYLSAEGVVNGYNDNTFKPLNSITRAEFTKLIVSAFFPQKQFEFSGNFKDVSADAWYADYVNIAYNIGIVSGDENGYFNPNTTISRQDIAVIIYNAGMKFNLFEDAVEYAKFSDDDEISDYAKTAIYTLRCNSVIDGIGNGLYAPLANANRASAAKILYELMLNSIK